jgi:hypothetical protein
MTPASTRTAEAPEDAADATRSEVGSPEAAAPVADLDTSAPAEAEADTVCLSNPIQSSPMQRCAALQCAALQCAALQCAALQCAALQCGAFVFTLVAFAQ